MKREQERAIAERRKNELFLAGKIEDDRDGQIYSWTEISGTKWLTRNCVFNSMDETQRCYNCMSSNQS